MEDRIIDIYWGNEAIDLGFAKRNGVHAVLCKATEGTSLPANPRDASKYSERKAKALKLNLCWAAYHLTNGASPAEQLAHFLSVEDGSDPNIGMAIDWEIAKDGTSLDVEELRELVRLFVRRFNGRFPILYGGHKIRDNEFALKNDRLLAACPLWYQQYSERDGPLPENAQPLHFPIGPWTQYALWQYSDEHGNLYGAPSFPQLKGADWNRFDGTAEELLAGWPFHNRIAHWQDLLAPAAEMVTSEAKQHALLLGLRSELPVSPVLTARAPATGAPASDTVSMSLETQQALLTQARVSPVLTSIEDLPIGAKAQAYAMGNANFESRAALRPDSLIGVAEGDSWFDYLPAYFEDPLHGDLLGHLNHDRRFNIYKVAKAGDTLENMAYGTDVASDYQPRSPELLGTIEAIKTHRPHFFLFSAGGNDLSGSNGVKLEEYLNHADTKRETLRLERARETFSTINREAYELVIAKIRETKPDIQIFVHGYDYAVPDGRPVFRAPFGFHFIGPWLLPAFARKRIWPEDRRLEAIKQLIDMHNALLAELAAKYSYVHHIDCRGLLRRDPQNYRQDWANELHPTAEGFGIVATKFATEILGVFHRQRGTRRSRRRSSSSKPRRTFARRGKAA